MKTLMITAALFTTLAAAPSARADLERPCTTKAACTRKPTCKTGFSLVAAGGNKFYCQKVTTAVEKELFTCSKGALKSVEGLDYCQWSAVRTPECGLYDLVDDWEWNKAAKKCRRVANTGAVKWETANIECDQGLTYKATTGKCEGTLRDGWTLIELYAKCTTQLAGSGPVIDFEGTKDFCAKSDADTTYAAPTVEAN